MTNAVLSRLLARMDVDERRPMLEINATLPIEDRWMRLRMNYATFQALVDAGLEDWGNSDPYQIADWVRLFTPIEVAAWNDIRSAGLPLWPQLPVGRFFLDFGNPKAKVALECDGRRWHSPEKDAARDAWLQNRGWTIYRAPGWRCMADTELPESYAEADPEDQAAIERIRNDQTMVGLIRSMKSHFHGRYEA